MPPSASAMVMRIFCGGAGEVIVAGRMDTL